MRQARLRLIAAQHTGDLGGTRFAGYLVQMRLGNIARFLADDIMLVGHDGNLRQVGYDNHLMRSGEICQHARKCTRRGATDTSIDLVKHQRINTVRVTEDNLACQHDAAELAARRNAAKGTWRQAGTAAV